MQIWRKSTISIVWFFSSFHPTNMQQTVHFEKLTLRMTLCILFQHRHSSDMKQKAFFFSARLLKQGKVIRMTKS